MYEKRFLEQALEELQVLRDENEELKRKLMIYEEFAKKTKKILNKWKKAKKETDK